MKTNAASTPSVHARGPVSGDKQATAQRVRGTFRRQLTATGAGGPNIGLEARRAAALILEVLAGVRTPAGAATALGIRLPRYYLLEQRAIQGLIAACQPRPVGRTVSTDRQLARLERELAVSQRELARHQALARTTQRALGLAPPATPRSTATSKAQQASGATKRRRRKPCVRALRAARLLQGDSTPGKDRPTAVQGAVGSSPAPGAVGSAIEAAAMEVVGSEPQGDHGGSNHAGRPKANEHR
jgi:hypothetical protein